MNRLRRSSASLAGTTILGSMLVVSACTVGPDYVRPAVETPPSFKEAQGWKVAQPQDEKPRGNWWEVFGDAQLNELAAQVDVNNQNIKLAEANVRQARALTEQARSAFFPR